MTSSLTAAYYCRLTGRRPGLHSFRWDNIGKWPMSLPRHQRRWVGNSRKIYQPTLRILEPEANEAQNVSPVIFEGQPAIAADNADGSIAYRMSSTFVFCGGSVKASFYLQDADDRACIEAWATDNILAQ